MTETVKERVIEVIARSQNMSPEQLSVDATFEEMGLNSLDALSLIFDLEEEFNVAIPNEEAMTIRSVRQAIESLQKMVSAQASESGATSVN